MFIIPLLVVGGVTGLSALTGRATRIERGMNVLRMLTANSGAKWSSLSPADRANAILALRSLKATTHATVLMSGRTNPTKEEMAALPNEALLLAAHGINISKLQP